MIHKYWNHGDTTFDFLPAISPKQSKENVSITITMRLDDVVMSTNLLFMNV